MNFDEISHFPEEKLEETVNAVKRDDVDALKDVVTVPITFTFIFNHVCCNLLRLSCKLRKKKVFDYLLGLNCFDLNPAADFSMYEKTILEEALCDTKGDYFGVKLIKAGADVFKIFCNKGTYLHHAIRYSSFESAELLIQKGIAINARDWNGRTPLHLYLKSDCSHERVDWLLQYGADIAIPDIDGYLPFDYSVIFGNELHVQEHLFHYTFDSHSDYKIQSPVLAALTNSPLFDTVMDAVSEVTDSAYLPVSILVMRPHVLIKLIEKCGDFIKEMLLEVEPNYNLTMEIDTLEILLNSELRSDTVQFIVTLDLLLIVYYNGKKGISKEKVLSLILYLISYGLDVTTSDCRVIYESEGYSDLFKAVLVHLDYPDTSRYFPKKVNIIVDIHCDLNTILRKVNYLPDKTVEWLLDYFVHPELKSFIILYSMYKPELMNKVRRLPNVPSLLQLARDATRRHIVRRFKLEKTSQYYWVLRKLEIGTIYEKILSFETKLYG